MEENDMDKKLMIKAPPKNPRCIDHAKTWQAIIAMERETVKFWDKVKEKRR